MKPCNTRVINKGILIRGLIICFALSGSISVSKATEPAEVRTWEHPSVAGRPTVIQTKTAARFVGIQLKGEGWLHLAEVEVIGKRGNSSRVENLALKRPTQQSSTAENGAASAKRAVDGDTNGDFKKGSVSHTNFEENPWWQVDLGADFAVEEVRIWNRTDNSEERLTDFRVILSLTPAFATQAVTTSVGFEDVDSVSTMLIRNNGTWGYLRLPVFGVVLLLVAWLLHMAWWRIHLPRNQNGALILTFFSVLAAGLCLAWFFRDTLPVIRGPWEVVMLTVFYVPLALMYVSLYSLIEEESPTLALIGRLSKAGPGGLCASELVAEMERKNDRLLVRRLHLMERDSLIRREGDCSILTTKGRRWAIIFTFGSRLIGLRRGE